MRQDEPGDGVNENWTLEVGRPKIGSSPRAWGRNVALARIGIGAVTTHDQATGAATGTSGTVRTWLVTSVNVTATPSVEVAGPDVRTAKKRIVGSSSPMHVAGDVAVAGAVIARERKSKRPPRRTR